jgi:hypothetical protein
MDDETFPSKVDPWLGVVLAWIPLGGGLAGLGLAVSGNMLAGAVTLALTVALMGGLVWPVRYELRADALVIRFGLVRSRVPYGRIRGVKPTRTLISSPALSLDRLHVDAGSSLGPNISPKDKGAFLRALARRAPHLRLAGDRLVSDA